MALVANSKESASDEEDSIMTVETSDLDEIVELAEFRNREGSVVRALAKEHHGDLRWGCGPREHSLPSSTRGSEDDASEVQTREIVLTAREREVGVSIVGEPLARASKIVITTSDCSLVTNRSIGNNNLQISKLCELLEINTL